MISRRRLLLAVLALAGGQPPAPGFAHSLLVRSQPGRGATVARAPERVRLWFSERLEPAYATLSVVERSRRTGGWGDAAVGRRIPPCFGDGAESRIGYYPCAIACCR